MRLIPHPPEIRAEAKRLGETTRLSCAAIAAQLGIPASTVRGWKRIDGWKRPPGAPTRRVFTRRTATPWRGCAPAAPGTPTSPAFANCHPDTVARAARRGSERRAAEAAPVAAPFAASAPEEVAALRQGLLAGGLGKRELLGLVRRASRSRSRPSISSTTARFRPTAAPRGWRASPSPSRRCRTTRRPPEQLRMITSPDPPLSRRPTLSWRSLRGAFPHLA